MVGLLGDGLVLFCWGDSFEEDLCWGPRLGVFMDLVECDDGDEANDGTALFKTIEAFWGAFFFSTSVELKAKGAGGGGADREIRDSDTSLPSVLTSRHF